MLLERAGNYDIRAFEEVYRMTSAFVYNVALHITRKQQDAEGVTQDVFIRVYRNLKNFHFRSAFSIWLYRIVVNTALNKYRKRAKEYNRNVEYKDNVTPDLYLEVEGHLKGCPVCQSLKEELLSGQRLIRNLQYEEVPQNIWNNIYEEISQEGLRKKTLLGLGEKLNDFLFKGRRRLVFATLTMVIFFVFAGIIFKNTKEEVAIQRRFNNYQLNGEMEGIFYDLGTNFEQYFL